MSQAARACAVVAVAGSAGAYQRLFELLGALPADFPAAVLVALHVPADQPSQLAALLNRACALNVQPAQDGLCVQPGQVYTAVPNHHLLLEGGRLRLSSGPRENRARPSLDVLLRSVALRGPDAAGVLLSGLLDDGVSGLWTVQRCGGLSIVQHPDDAEYPDLPLNALRQVEAQRILPVSQMPALLREWARERQSSVDNDLSPQEVTRMDAKERERLHTELQYAAGEPVAPQALLGQVTPTPLTCPECGGVLTEIPEGQQVRYRCHTGHAFTGLNLLSEVRRNVEKTLWSALRAVQEKQLLLEQVTRHLHAAGNAGQARQLQTEVDTARISREALHRIIVQEQRRGPLDPSLTEQGP